ncbi:hypothetical protein [Paenibacillus dakarensis]|uniref:hypothetical protein n=1 Tax=Paenibacillus dakarensis TaxID=1527293 RepID=UPI000AB391D4|nr:hypothetical protein [Paenibacillus dakarensis]
MKMEKDMITANLLRLCYHCEDAHLCESEEKCRACWTEQGQMAEDHAEEGQRETKEFLQLMHA